MEREIAKFLSEIIYYIEERIKLNGKDKEIIVTSGAFPVTKKELGPHATRELNNFKKIIEHYYSFVRIRFIRKKESGIIRMTITFDFIQMLEENKIEAV